MFWLEHASRALAALPEDEAQRCDDVLTDVGEVLSAWAGSLAGSPLHEKEPPEVEWWKDGQARNASINASLQAEMQAFSALHDGYPDDGYPDWAHPDPIR